MCLSNDEVEPQWMRVLETESVFKNFIYILENSLNGKIHEVFQEIDTISHIQNKLYTAVLMLVRTVLYLSVVQPRMKHLTHSVSLASIYNNYY